MATISIGQMVTLNGKDYKITGKDKKSFILEYEGKEYKATAEKIQKILDQNSAPQGSFLERRIARNRLFNKSARMPETEEEAMHIFVSLTCELSPENLSCDGEASAAQVKAKLREIKGAWAELEQLIGKSISEDYVWRWEQQNRQKNQD